MPEYQQDSTHRKLRPKESTLIFLRQLARCYIYEPALTAAPLRSMILN